MFGNQKLSGWRLLQNKEEDEEDDQVDVPNLKEVQALSRIERRIRRLQILAGFLSIVTLVSVIFSGLLWAHRVQETQVTSTPSKGNVEPGRTMTDKIAGNSIFPEFPTRLVTFDEDYLIEDPPSNVTNMAWRNLFPAGSGWVAIPDPQSHGLPEGKDNGRNDGTQDFAVTMYHQLHCVEILRTAYFTLRFGQVNHFARGKHVHHCLDYLVQSIKCSGDLTLEWPKDYMGKPGTTTEGWGITHQCIDSDAVFAWAEAHAGLDREHIDEELGLSDGPVQ